MIKLHPNRTLDDARRVIRNYGLDQFDWNGVGTAEGFANRLFAPGTDMTTSELADAFHAYLETCGERGTEDVDRQWREQANDRQTTLRRRARERQMAADFIRDVKFTAPGGGMCWRAVAELATTDDRLSLLSQLSVEACEELQTVLHGIEALEPLFPSWYALPYAPGNRFVDACLRLDIERFDVTLETAEPWTDQDEDWFEEASALLRLAKHSNVQNELETVIEASEAPDSPMGDAE